MADRRRPHAPPRPPAPRARSGEAAARARASGQPSSTQPSVTQVSSTQAPSSRAPERAGEVAGRARMRAASPRASSTLSAHRPDPGAVATPWAKVAAGSATVSHRMQERLRERQSARTRLLALRWGKRLGVVAAVAAVVWLVLMSPVFAFDPERLEASGHGSVVDPERVTEVVAAYEGRSLAMLDTGDIAAELETLVGVRAVEIDRVWPAGLRIAITSSEPVAAIPREGEGFVLVDDQGAEVDSTAEAPAHLPVVTIPIGSGETETRILGGVLGVIDELPVELRDRVEGIEADTEDSIHFVLRDGPRVEWGSGEQSALKAQVLQVLLDSADASEAAVIDVSAPSLPITRED